MSLTSVRALAATVAVIIAVLTGAATGLLSGARTCSIVQGQPVSTPTTAAPTTAPATAGGGGVGLGVAEPGTPSPSAVGAKPVPPQAAPATMSCSTAAFGGTPALTAFLGAAFVGGALLLLLLLTSRGRTAPGTRGAAPVVPRPAGTAAVPTTAVPPVPVASGAPVASAVRAEADRTALVNAVIYVRDRVTSTALSDRLGAALREAGVDILEPTGARFDPARHEAGGSAPSTDPSKIGSIAAVEVAGYTDRGGRILRPPVVTVYQGGGYREHSQEHSRDRTRGDQTRGDQR